MSSLLAPQETTILATSSCSILGDAKVEPLYQLPGFRGGGIGNVPIVSEKGFEVQRNVSDNVASSRVDRRFDE
jgi:hypothetical protein